MLFLKLFKNILKNSHKYIYVNIFKNILIKKEKKKKFILKNEQHDNTETNV